MFSQKKDALQRAALKNQLQLANLPIRLPLLLPQRPLQLLLMSHFIRR
jgi:hypothetical protein